MPWWGMSRRFYMVVFHSKGSCQVGRLSVTRELRACARWWNYVPDLWIVGTEESAKALSKRLRQHMHEQEDQIFICEIRRESDMAGWLPAEAWDWLLTEGLLVPRSPVA